MKNQIKISKENALLITSMEQLLTQIDSIKEKITDQEYKDMMDSLKILHDKEDDEYKYELVIARIHNHNKDVSHEPIEYRIEKMVLIPKNSFRPYKAKELILDNECFVCDKNYEITNKNLLNNAIDAINDVIDKTESNKC